MIQPELEELINEITNDLGFNDSLSSRVTVLEIINKASIWKGQQIINRMESEKGFEAMQSALRDSTSPKSEKGTSFIHAVTALEVAKGMVGI